MLWICNRLQVIGYFWRVRLFANAFKRKENIDSIKLFRSASSSLFYTYIQLLMHFPLTCSISEWH